MKISRLCFAIAAGLCLLGMIGGPAGQKQKAWDGNRTTPVHVIPLRDEFDQPIIPTEPNPMPYSARYTCGPCHDYGTVRTGLHFNTVGSSNSGRPGEPWVWVDRRTGTWLPLSFHNWKGSWNPRTVGLSLWDFTLIFGRHMPGGGPGEPEETDETPDDRWNVSGEIEIDCLSCHNASFKQDLSEWAKQVLRENFRWAATAASGLGEVGGMASRLKGTWDIYEGPNPDDQEWAVAPYVKYKPADFDSKHRYFFDVVHKPDDNRCLACHSVSAVSVTKSESDADVHSKAGIKCVECHRNDLGHAMIRGYEGENAQPARSAARSFTCRGCHLGEDPSGKKNVTPGRMGAPYPKHKGIPVVHFKYLSCTVCHAGPAPAENLTQVRTSRANRLGIYGIAQWSTDSPKIDEPVYIKDERGVITPNRLTWPAFWGRLKGKEIAPLKPSEARAAAAEFFDSEKRIGQVLLALSYFCENEEVPVLITQGNIFELNADGGLNPFPRTAEKLDFESSWRLKKAGHTSPLISDFDPDAENKDPEIEPRIQRLLEALATMNGAPGRPVLIVKKTLYRLTDGNLETAEAPKEPAGKLQVGWAHEGKFLPLASDFDIRTAAATAGKEQSLTEEQVGLILKALAQAATKKAESGHEEYVYVSGGKMFRLDNDGKLSFSRQEAAEPVAWPFAHDVRPAQQSLGWNGCKDCHRAGSAFFFAEAKGSGPLLTQNVEKRSSHSFMGLDRPFQTLFGLSFTIRPLFKGVLFAAAVVIGSLLLIVFFLVLGKLSGLIEKR
jgi:hypothetical protein